ncbi:MAG: hypothetical protein COU30_03995, partial [Candidatus Magasanikbacteria bacterium CG10_big_fil_rev_8_21_14_0_10_38_6]
DIAAGKGTLATYVNNHYTAKTLRFSTVLRDILDRLYLEQSRKNLADLANALRQTFGSDILATTLVNDANNADVDIILVEGIRSQGELDLITSLPNAHIIYLTANPHIRWKRVVERNENPGDAQKTFEQFQQDETHESDKYATHLGAQAEYKIINEQDLPTLYTQIDNIINPLLHERTN